MGALLVDEWLADSPAIEVVDEASVALVREEVRRVAAAVGLDAAAAESLASAASELAHNQRVHAGGGRVAVRAISRAGVAGVEVVAADRGPGIGEPAAALRGEGRAPRGLGVGLSAAYRLADEMDFDVRAGEGTCVWARKLAAPLPRSEVAILGRPCRGELVSGDHAGFVRRGDELLLAVADGLGHGPPARAAADAALLVIREHAGLPLPELLKRCDPALASTRGAAVALARLGGGELVACGAGNVSVHLYQTGRHVRFTSAARVVGRPTPGAVREERSELAPRHLVLLFSDGLSSRLDVTADLELQRQPPLVIAHELIARSGQPTDDCTVLVARLG